VTLTESKAFYTAAGNLTQSSARHSLQMKSRVLREVRWKKIIGAQYVVGMYSNLDVSAREVPICNYETSHMFRFVFIFFSPLYSGKPKADEGPFGMASVFSQERRSAGSVVDSMNVEVGRYTHFSLAVHTVPYFEWTRQRLGQNVRHSWFLLGLAHSNPRQKNSMPSVSLSKTPIPTTTRLFSSTP
jgi:hypothetical protein